VRRPDTVGHWVPEMVELAGGRDELGPPLAASWCAGDQ